MIKIRLISIWIGEIQSSFRMFWKSAAYNYNVDFMCFTDHPEKMKSMIDNAQNINVKYITLSDINDRVHKRLKNEFCVNTPYKLCDLRPFIGLLFSEYLEGYEYWGFHDFDMIFGNLNPLLDKMGGGVR